MFRIGAQALGNIEGCAPLQQFQRRALDRTCDAALTEHEANRLAAHAPDRGKPTRRMRGVGNMLHMTLPAGSPINEEQGLLALGGPHGSKWVVPILLDVSVLDLGGAKRSAGEIDDQQPLGAKAAWFRGPTVSEGSTADRAARRPRRFRPRLPATRGHSWR